MNVAMSTPQRVFYHTPHTENQEGLKLRNLVSVDCRRLEQLTQSNGLDIVVIYWLTPFSSVGLFLRKKLGENLAV